MLSSRCRGITVTSSISHRKAASEGLSPGVRGAAIARRRSERKRDAVGRVYGRALCMLEYILL